MTGAELLKMEEEDFSKRIQEMTIKDLMETISDLQKEMAKEQENFNLLSSELKNFKDRNSRQYKQISKDMVASQHRLTLLMNRSIKCFAQQNTHNNSDSPLKRRNSVKGPSHAAPPASAWSNLQRSKSLLAVNQTDGSHLPSSFQSPAKPHAAEPGTSVHYNMNATHVPVIMTTSKNGTVKKSNEAGVGSNINDRSRQGNDSTDTVSSSKEKNQQSAPPASITVNRGMAEGSSNVNRRDSASGVNDSNSVTVSSSTGVGMYVKRKPAQQLRVTTTANISSSKFMTTTQPVPLPLSEPASSISSSLASSSTRAPSTRSAGPVSVSSVANESQFVKSKPSVSEYVSPLQMAQARKRVSKSQTIIQDKDSSYQGLRGLPSVKLLAQSFGSNTALNTIPGSSTNHSGSQTSKFIISSGSGVYRSNSTFNLSNPQTAAAPTRIYISKGSTAGDSEQTSQQEPAFYVNGKSQQTSKQHSRLPQASTSNFNSEPTEWENTRSKLRTVKREIVAETIDGIMNSGVVAPLSHAASFSVRDKERVDETPPADKYVKRKDNAAGKTSTVVQSASSVTIKSINSPSSLASSKITNSAPISTSQNKNPSQSHVSSTSPSVKTSNVNSVSKHHGTSSNSPHTKTQTLPHFSTTQQKQQSVTSSSKMSYATMPHRDHGSGDKVISAATVSLRRAKSREELQQIENDTRSNKDMVLKQIQARRKDTETRSDRPNIRGMSSLSQSLPSLLLDDTDGFHEGGDGSKTSPVKSSIAPSAETTPADFTTFVDDGIELDDEDRVPRMNLRNWDPDPVYSVLYEVKLMDEVIEDISHQFITMEGLMEKLPMNKRKATLLKTWKRRFFRAKDGWLYYYESSNTDQPSESIQLMGGSIYDIGGRVLGIDDGRGRYLMVRCPTEKEYGQWKVSLESQTADNTKATYVRPVLKSPRHASKNVVIIDLGSSAIRAGILGQQACLPELFFPSLVAVDKDSSKVVAVGRDALRPDIRHRYKVIHPIRPSNKVDQFNIEVHLMRAIFDKVFHELNVNPPDYWVMVSTPQNLGDPLKKGLMEILVDALKVKGVCMVPQALLSLYSYNATSGIIVDIGHRMEILPIFDGFVIEGGVARCPYGAQKVQESLTTDLLSNNYKFFSTTEQLLVRYTMERVCFVAIDYPLEVEWVNSQPQTARTFVNFRKFGLPDGSYKGVECDVGRFKSPEGFFNVNMWEMDYQTLQKLVYQAIQTCPMDNRRHVWRAIFLSGGVTLLPGFAERLEKELSKLAPPGVPVEVHAAPQRYHAAFVGACSVALMPQFEGMAISKEEWKKDGVKAFKKWQAPSS